MTVDAKLYINSKWDLADVVTVLKRNYGEVEIKTCHDNNKPTTSFIHMYHINIIALKRMITVITNTTTPLGPATYLSLGANDEATGIFKTIANTFGGLFIENDYANEMEWIQGSLSTENALPYFINYAIIHDGIEPDDHEGLLKSMSGWYDRCDNPNKPEWLKIATLNQ